MVTRRRVVLGLGVGALAPRASLAQQPRKVSRIGLLTIGSKEYFVSNGFQKLFLQGMREYGYALDRDFIIEERFADGEVGRLPALAAELVRIPVDLILTSGTQANRAAQQATTASKPRPTTGWARSFSCRARSSILIDRKLQTSRQDTGSRRRIREESSSKTVA